MRIVHRHRGLRLDLEERDAQDADGHQHHADVDDVAAIAARVAADERP